MLEGTWGEWSACCWWSTKGTGRRGTPQKVHTVTRNPTVHFQAFASLHVEFPPKAMGWRLGPRWC